MKANNLKTTEETKIKTTFEPINKINNAEMGKLYGGCANGICECSTITVAKPPVKTQ